MIRMFMLETMLDIFNMINESEYIKQKNLNNVEIFLFYNYDYSKIAAIPGKVCPSNISNMAPPPVET